MVARRTPGGALTEQGRGFRARREAVSLRIAKRALERIRDEIHDDDARADAERVTGRSSNWSPEDLKAHIGFMMRFAKELSESGELVGAEGLAGPDQARIVRAGKNGAPEVTDGPFPEAKEFLAGYWIVDVENAGARLRARRARLGCARSRRQTAQHADRSA